MTIENRELALKASVERWHRYLANCDRDAPAINPNFEFVANLLMEFSDVASMALDALADLVPGDYRSETVNLARENLRAMILRPQPERAIPSVVQEVVKELFHGPALTERTILERLLKIYDEGRETGDALHTGQTVSMSAGYAEAQRYVDSERDESLSALHNRAWKRENETRAANETREYGLRRRG